MIPLTSSQPALPINQKAILQVCKIKQEDLADRVDNTATALFDCAYINPSSQYIHPSDLCKIQKNGRELILPLKSSPKIPLGKVGLNFYQRQFFPAYIDDCIHVTLLEESSNSYETVRALEVSVSSFGKKKTNILETQVKECLLKSFNKHIINWGHTLVMKLENETIEILVQKIVTKTNKSRAALLDKEKIETIFCSIFK